MFNFKEVEYEGQTSKIASFNAKMISLGETILSNINNTQYRIAVIEFPNAQGELVQRTAIAYETSIQNAIDNEKPPMSGETYSCQVVLNDGQPPLLKILFGGNSADRATLDDFGVEVKETIFTDVEEVISSEEVEEVPTI